MKIIQWNQALFNFVFYVKKNYPQGSPIILTLLKNTAL